MLMDVKYTRVDNGWLLFMLSISFPVRICMEGWRSMPSFILGVCFPFVALIGLYYFRMLGPGDIKLLCVLGGMVGVKKIGILMLITLFFGGMIAFLILACCGLFRERMRYFLSYLKDTMAFGTVRPYYRNGMVLENFHFTVPIFMSTMLYAGGVF